MDLPELNPGTAVFIPRHGVFTVIGVRVQRIGDTAYDICDLRHYFSKVTSSRASAAMAQARVRVPTKIETAVHIVQQLREVPRRKLQGHWNKQSESLNQLLKQGTLEKNLEVVRLLHDINQDRWKAARVDFYQNALQLVVEELAYVFNEPLSAARRTVVTTLNNTALPVS